jgi:hypothetical protein
MSRGPAKETVLLSSIASADRRCAAAAFPARLAGAILA